jgi:hypothetical protein
MTTLRVLFAQIRLPFSPKLQNVAPELANSSKNTTQLLFCGFLA